MRYIFLVPWKVPKNSLLFSYIHEFLGRVSKFVPCELVTPHTALDEKDVLDFYLKEIKKINIEKPLCFAFDENGTQPSSAAFAKSLQQLEVQGEKCALFCLGSAYGLPKELLLHVRLKLISLSALTFPHELALAVTLEQIYRARCIISNHPYHHGDKSPLALQVLQKHGK